MDDDYIKRSDALNASKIVYIEYIEIDGDGYEDGNADEIPVVFKRDIEAIPAADVVPVVRCKDCKWWKLSDYNTMGIHICQRFSGVRGEHDFCSRGEADNG